MASICLFDIDFLYSSKFVPNLELMKIFNYYYQEGHVVNLGQKNENLDRYNQIIFVMIDLMKTLKILKNIKV